MASMGLVSPPVHSLSHNLSICERSLGSVSNDQVLSMNGEGVVAATVTGMPLPERQMSHYGVVCSSSHADSNALSCSS